MHGKSDEAKEKVNIGLINVRNWKNGKLEVIWNGGLNRVNISNGVRYIDINPNNFEIWDW